jgi:hypothetical protein
MEARLLPRVWRAYESSDDRSELGLTVGGDGIFKKVDATVWHVIQDHVRRLR